MVTRIYRSKRSQEGAALVTVVLISLLLLTACAAMLSAVGASSRNNTDALNESKAYWGAESGLQATINELRNTPGLTYSAALAQQSAGTFPATGPNPVGDEVNYKVVISDPDNSGASTTYSTDAEFLQADGTYAATRVFGTSPDTTTLSYESVASTSVSQPMTGGTPFGRFQIQNTGNGAALEVVNFRVNFRMSLPRGAVRTMRGSITAAGDIIFDVYTYQLMGSDIDLCSDAACAAPGAAFPLTLPMATTVLGQSPPVFGKMDPIEPFRLKIVSTGMGPGNSRKQLEAVIQKNFFNDLGPSAAISMIGPNATFIPGTSSQMEVNGGSFPSVGVLDQTGLNTVNTAHTNGTLTPPPAILGPEIPDWQLSAEAMDALIGQLRQTAQNSGRYFGPTSRNPTSFGDFASGTGITFCDGNCTMGGNSTGGGILVVTGTFTTSGNPSFKGLVLAVGPGGIVRGGGGNELFIGNIVVAPYDPNNLAAGFSSPVYNQNGGPGSTVYSSFAVSNAFNGTGAVTNFMLGVAEK